MDGQMTIFDFIPDPTKVYECEIRGLCDDAYCPECGYGFLENEVDRPECPNCGTRVSWGKYHRINDEVKRSCENCNRYRRERTARQKVRARNDNTVCNRLSVR